MIPSLLSNPGTWVEISETAVDKLDAMQDTFGRVPRSLPQSTARASLRAALGLVGMKQNPIG